MSDTPHDRLGPDPLGAPPFGADPFGVERLDGHTVEELSDYLEAGRTPADPSIDDSAGCQIALAALERLRAVSLSALDVAEREAERDEGWVHRLMADIAVDAHAGRDIPVAHVDPRVHLAVTEGAIRELVRSTGDALPGIVTGRVRLVGDVETLGADLSAEITATVRYGVPIPIAVQQLRVAVREAVRSHTGIDLSEIAVTVTDVHGLPEELR